MRLIPIINQSWLQNVGTQAGDRKLLPPLNETLTTLYNIQELSYVRLASLVLLKYNLIHILFVYLIREGIKCHNYT